LGTVGQLETTQNKKTIKNTKARKSCKKFYTKIYHGRKPVN